MMDHDLHDIDDQNKETLKAIEPYLDSKKNIVKEIKKI